MAPIKKTSFLPGVWQHFFKSVSPPNQSHARELICQHKLMQNPIADFKLAQHERQVVQKLSLKQAPRDSDGTQSEHIQPLPGKDL